MIENTTLEGAIAQAFDLKDVPEFKQMKPVAQAQSWLKEQGVSTRYDKKQVRKGIVVFSRGGGVLYAVVSDVENDILPKNAQVLGSLSLVETAEKAPETAKNEKKSRKSTKKDDDTSESE